MNKFSLALVAAAFLSFFTLSSPAHADGGYAGVLLGPSFVNAGLGTGFVWGGRAGARLSDNFSFGFYATHQSLVSVSGSAGGFQLSANASETIIAFEPNLYLSKDVPIYIGAKVGMGILTGEATIATDSGNSITGSASVVNFAAGPAIGMDVEVAANFSIGGELNSIFITTAGKTMTLINLLATATFRF